MYTVTLTVSWADSKGNPLVASRKKDAYIEVTLPTATQDILFTSNRDGNPEIYRMRADGTGQERLTHCLDSDWFAHWSPDAARIVFDRVAGGQDQLFLMNADGSGVTGPLGAGWWPAWAPDGTAVAFIRSAPGGEPNDQIWLMNPDGSNQRQLTVTWEIDGGVTWSPDGTRIALQVYTGGAGGHGGSEHEIWIVDSSDGTVLDAIQARAADDGGVSWSPDGSGIAFTSRRDGNNEVYVMNVDGTGQTNLTHSAEYDWGPVWSPTGTQLAFHREEAGVKDVYIMNADGSGQTNLTNNPADDARPDW